jgi:hypothetical protein
MGNKLNIELFKKIREKIATTPEAYDQSVFARRSVTAPCGTAACIAGWACVLSGAMDAEELMRRERANGAEFRSIEITAKSALGVDDDEAETLFTEDPEGTSFDWSEDDDERGGGWPQPFAGQWEDATRSERPRIAIAFLDHIIETGKILE